MIPGSDQGIAPGWPLAWAGQQISADASPAIVRVLSDTRVSRSCLLHSAGGRLVLRQDYPAARRIGLDRGSEWAILQAAYAGGLGPEPIAFSPERGWLLTAWLPGEAWQAEHLQQPVRLQALGECLRAVHALPAAGAKFEPLAIARRYAASSEAPQAQRLLASITSMVAELYPDNAARCLCHHDPHAGNLVGVGPSRLIDWEYAALGDPLFDLAAVIGYHGLSADQRLLLLDAWSGNTGPQQRERLTYFERFYAVLTRLWQLALG